MEQKTYKKLFRLFTIADYEKEEIFLREQHKQGWRIVKYTLPGIYTFESCTPEDVVYQLDFTDIDVAQNPAYLQMFADYGWKYLFDVNGFSYFCKPAASQKPEDLTIFSDSQSKLDMIKKIALRRVFPLCVIFLCCILPQLPVQTQFDRLPNRILFWFFIVMFILYMALFIHFGITFFKWKKKYQKG